MSGRPVTSGAGRREPEWAAALRRWSAIGAWVALAIVCAASLTPQSALPEDLPSPVLLHFVAYAIPAALSTLAAMSGRKAIVAALAILLISLAIEVAQSLIPGRYAEFADAVANTAGVIAGLAAGRAAVALLRLGPAAG